VSAGAPHYSTPLREAATNGLDISAIALVSLHAWKLSSKPKLYEALLLHGPKIHKTFSKTTRKLPQLEHYIAALPCAKKKA